MRITRGFTRDVHPVGLEGSGELRRSQPFLKVTHGQRPPTPASDTPIRLIPRRTMDEDRSPFGKEIHKTVSVCPNEECKVCCRERKYFVNFRPTERYPKVSPRLKDVRSTDRPRTRNTTKGEVETTLHPSSERQTNPI